MALLRIGGNLIFGNPEISFDIMLEAVRVMQNRRVHRTTWINLDISESGFDGSFFS